MSLIKLFLALVVVLTVALGGYFLLDQNLRFNLQDGTTGQAVSVTTAAGIEWYQDKFKSLQVAVFTDRELSFDFYSQNAPSLEEQASLNNYLLAINGSYYQGSYVKAEHAGLLQVKGTEVKALGYDRQEQATHVVVYNHKTGSIQFLDTREIKLEQYQSADYSLMQTGPLLIANSEVATDFIDKSLNGKGRYTRTVLGYTPSGKKFVAISRVAFTLPDLAQRLLEMEVFADEELSVINLDGGSSTAMFTTVVDSFNFGQTKRLPIVIGIK